MNLHELDSPRRETLETLMRRTMLVRGTVVYAPGDRVDAVYFIIEGRIKIVRATAAGYETIVGIRTPGDVFGELSWLNDRTMRVTRAVALDDGCCGRIELAEFDRLLRSDGTLAAAFAQGVVHRLTVAELEVAELAGKSVPGRLVDVLGRLAADHGIDEQDGSIRIGLPLTHSDLADLIGTSRETLTRELGVLAEVGLLRVAPRAISLIRPNAFPFVRRVR